MSDFTQHSEELSTRSDIRHAQSWRICFVLFFLQTSSRSAKAPKHLAKKQDPDLMGSESISSIFYRHRFMRKNKRNRWSRKTSGFKKRKEKKRERLASLHLLLLLFLFLDPHRASRRFALSRVTRLAASRRPLRPNERRRRCAPLLDSQIPLVHGTRTTGAGRVGAEPGTAAQRKLICSLTDGSPIAHTATSPPACQPRSSGAGWERARGRRRGWLLLNMKCRSVGMSVRWPGEAHGNDSPTTDLHRPCVRLWFTAVTQQPSVLENTFVPLKVWTSWTCTRPLAWSLFHRYHYSWYLVSPIKAEPFLFYWVSLKNKGEHIKTNFNGKKIKLNVFIWFINWSAQALCLVQDYGLYIFVVYLCLSMFNNQTKEKKYECTNYETMLHCVRAHSGVFKCLWTHRQNKYTNEWI